MSEETPQITAVDLFCGAGGLTHGLERAGVDVRLGVDLDPSCEHPYSSNNSANFLEADVSKLATDVIVEAMSEGGVTLLAGCAPCQTFSTYSRSAARAGHKKRRGRGNKDDWQLVRRFGELVTSVRPQLVTMENVPPLVDQPVFAEFLECLADYHVDYDVIDMRRIGLPQTRKRLVLVASRLGPINLPAPGDVEDAATVRQVIGELGLLAAGETDPKDPLHVASRLSATNLARIKVSKPGGT